jgi:hypothetical protein
MPVTTLWKENIHETSKRTIIPVELLSTVTIFSPTETGPPHSYWYKRNRQSRCSSPHRPTSSSSSFLIVQSSAVRILGVFFEDPIHKSCFQEFSEFYNIYPHYLQLLWCRRRRFGILIIARCTRFFQLEIFAELYKILCIAIAF